jgi:CheY-like chemotaxis protein
MSYILLVEDEPNLRLFVQMNLCRRGFNTVAVTTAEEALQMIFHEPPSLLLLDMKLPSMSGLELLETLKRECPSVFPIMVFSVWARGNEAEIQQQHPAIFGLLDKPIAAPDLIAQVRSALELVPVPV